jgi:hypothetical protein
MLGGTRERSLCSTMPPSKATTIRSSRPSRPLLNAPTGVSVQAEAGLLPILILVELQQSTRDAVVSTGSREPQIATGVPETSPVRESLQRQ